eukprot:TRINITY_DN146_c0_g2_i1.p1 TRINITY_DN146_c0_g2~~TRINITY_DN146_c0_g2_i1.p1  ORF type:complete len:552 (+),score=95.05 TRINITY_DN146_c0_g2_i1:598-2253(+)
MEINRFLNQEKVVFEEGFPRSQLSTIAEGLKENSTIKKLVLHKSLLADVFPIITKGLQHNTKLTTLDLSDNALGVEEAKLISDVIRTNSSLESLNLDRNDLGPSGVGHLVEALKVNTSLRTIFLTRNKIGGDGAKLISDLITRNTPLRHLNIAFNQISHLGTEAIFESLRSNSTLRSVDLTWNEIDQSGVNKLAAALKENTTLVSLIINRNTCNKLPTGAIIFEALKSNSTLGELNCDDAFADKEQCSDLIEAWENTKQFRTLPPTSPSAFIPPYQRFGTPEKPPASPFRSSAKTSTEIVDITEDQDVNESEEIGFLNRMDTRQEKLNHIGPIQNFLNKIPKDLDQALSGLGSNSQKIISWLFAEDLVLNENYFQNDDPEPLDRNRLNMHQIAAINLYTREWSDPIYSRVNFYLRQENRSALRSYLPYLRLLVSGLSKLPQEQRTLWRATQGSGINPSKFKKGRKVFWWGFSSCASSNSIFDDPYFDAVEEKILFQIESLTAVCIQKYSVSLSEEYIFLPGSFFEVLEVETSGSSTFVHLRELQCPLSIFE